MTPAADFTVVCPESCLRRILDADGSLNFVATHDSVALLGGGVDVGALVAAGFEVSRLRDVYHLVAEAGDEGGRLAAERGLFEWLASRYEEDVDVANNLDNLRTLFRLALGESLDTKRRVILDFGCGVGLSRELRSTFDVDVIGCDVAAGMVERARARGLEVITAKELRTRESESFDAALCAYVLHLIVPVADLREVVRVLRPGCSLAANFHKGVREAEVAAQLAALGLEAVPLPSDLPKSHGTYRVWRKPR